jgi:hypothetical protein
MARMKQCGNAEDFKSTKAKRKKYAPKQLPRIRPRRLTDPPLLHSSRSWKDVLLGRHVTQQTFSTQSASILFARLPIEVRQVIWTNVLGGYLLHVARAPGRLIALPCADIADPKRATRKHSCWGWTDNPQQGSHTAGFYVGSLAEHLMGITELPDARPADFLLPLLQSCRQAYLEGISILYQKNVFDLNHIDTLFYLQRSVLPQRLVEIHSLNLSWNFRYGLPFSRVPYGLATWAEACSVLASLRGLQILRVRLTGHGIDFAHDRHLWGTMLEALMQIKSMGDCFEVFLPWSVAQCESAAKGEAYPFKLMSGEERED